MFNTTGNDFKYIQRRIIPNKTLPYPASFSPRRLTCCVALGPEPSPKPSTSPPSSLGSPGRRPPKSPSEHKERKPSSSDDKKKVVGVCSSGPGLHVYFSGLLHPKC